MFYDIEQKMQTKFTEFKNKLYDSLNKEAIENSEFIRKFDELHESLK
jgi:hypothetical protein